MFLKEARKLARRQVRKTMSMLGYAEQWGPRRSQDFWIPLAFCTLPFSSSTIPFFKCHAGLDMVVEMVTPGRGKERQGWLGGQPRIPLLSKFQDSRVTQENPVVGYAHISCICNNILLCIHGLWVWGKWTWELEDTVDLVQTFHGSEGRMQVIFRLLQQMLLPEPFLWPPLWF